MPDELDKDEGKKECIKYYNLRTNTTVTYADLKNKQPQKISESQIKRIKRISKIKTQRQFKIIKLPKMVGQTSPSDN